MTAAERTLFVVDDDPAACRSIEALAASIGLRCETFPSAERFLERFELSLSGGVVVDLRLGGMDGLELQQELVARGSTLPVVLISAYVDVRLAVRAMEHGAVTVLEKPYAADELEQAIRRAMEPGGATPPLRPRADIEARLQTLIARERRALDLIVSGAPNKALARELAVSRRTADRVRAAVFKKMGVQSAVELARLVSAGR